jgi:hypothetical protein
MCRNLKKYRNSIIKSAISLIFLISCNISYSLNTSTAADSLRKIPPYVINKIRENLSMFSREFLMSMPSSIQPSPVQIKDRNIVFFDSLKVKASKNLITRRLYSFIVINPDTLIKKRFSLPTNDNYSRYAGRKIRKIIIQRLNVFGVDINDPVSSNPKKIENILNKTHFNTAEKIIKKNLLFSEGQVIVPLTLSDNERFLRQLPYIDDARIIVVPVSDDEADVIVLTKDVYSLGGSYTYKGLEKGSVSVFDKNILGMGHEFGIDMPFDNSAPDSPGIGAHYIVNNIAKSFVNLNVSFLKGLGLKTYGFDMSRKLISSTTKYAGGISVRMMYISESLSTPQNPAPLKYNLQDYWLSRSFLINKESVSRIILGARYTNNNVFDHPLITSESFYNLQKYKIYLASAALSVQKYTKTNLLYSYGRTEDIPYGSLFKVTAGREYNEFKLRTYLGGEASFSAMSPALGYFYTYGGLSTYINKTLTEQGVLSLGMSYFSNLLYAGNSKIRNFVYLNYTRGFGRYTNEYLQFNNINGFSGFRNDTARGTQRLSVSLESVLFSPINLYGFRFAFFGFTDFSFLSGTTEILGRGYALSSIGVGIRVRNDNLVFNTLQIRIGYFPNPPAYSSISPVNVSGEQLLRPVNFEPGPPAVIPYR